MMDTDQRAGLAEDVMPVGYALKSHENPFFPSIRTLIAGIAAALGAALVVYAVLVQTSSSRLATAVTNSDTLYRMLETSPFYGGDAERKETSGPIAQPDERDSETATKQPEEVDDLALATWIRLLRLVPVDADVKTIIGDERFSLLLQALRHGNRCPRTGKDGTTSNGRLPVASPTVDRLIDLARYLANTDCANRNSQDGRDALAAGLVQRIAGLKPLPEQNTKVCSSLVNHIFIPRKEIDGGKTRVFAGCASFFEPVPSVSGREILTWLFNESGVYENARRADGILKSAKDARDKAEEMLAAAQTKRNEAETDLNQKVANPDPGNPGAGDAAKAALEVIERDIVALNAEILAKRTVFDELHAGPLSYFATIYRVRGGAYGDIVDYEDGRLQAIEEFSIALIASIDADPKVSESRLWLSVWRGYEQFIIIALAGTTLSLLVKRSFSFRERSRDVDETVDRIEELAIPDVDLEAQTGKQHLAITSLRAEVLRDAKLHEPPTLDGRRVRIRTELVDAALADLSQLSRYGLSDEHLEHAALELKDKIAASRVGIDWCIAALPAIGFIGTVRGILNALSGVGGLTQGDAAARLQTLLQVSASLGLAFATTLLALIAMLLLSYVDVKQARSERNLVDQFRDYLGRKVLS